MQQGTLMQTNNQHAFASLSADSHCVLFARDADTPHASRVFVVEAIQITEHTKEQIQTAGMMSNLLIYKDSKCTEES